MPTSQVVLSFGMTIVEGKSMPPGLNIFNILLFCEPWGTYGTTAASPKSTGLRWLNFLHIFPISKHMPRSVPLVEDAFITPQATERSHIYNILSVFRWPK